MTQFYYSLTAIILLLLAAARGGFAQPPPNSPLTPTWPKLAERGLVAGRTFDVSSLENISIENGTVNLSIPLASFPAGPGGSSYGLGLVYNSQIFDTSLGPQMNANNGTGEVTLSTQLGSSTHGGGWNYSWQYSINYEIKKFPSGAASCGADDLKRHRLSMVFPDGSQHLLHLRDFYGDSSGYYGVEPFPVSPSTSATNQTGCNTFAGVASTLIYYTDDGTFARLEVNPVTSVWKLYQKDGGRVEGNGILNSRVDKVVDRNGNAITFVYAIVDGRPDLTMRDELGRTISIGHTLSTPLDPIPKDIVSGPGANGSTLQWFLYWGSPAPNPSYSIYYKCVAASNFDFCSTSPYTSGLTKVVLPTLDAGTVLKYEFGYNSNASDHGRGELSSIKSPYGATTTYQYTNMVLSNPAVSADMSAVDGDQSNPIASKTLTYRDTTGTIRTEVTSYGAWVGVATTGATKTVTYPDGGQRVYVQRDLLGDSGSQRRIGAIVEPNGDRLDRIWRRNCPIQIWDQQPGNPYVKAEFRLTKSSLGDKTSAQFSNYDRNGNLLNQSAYDFGTVTRDTNGFPNSLAAPSGAALIRTVTNAYFLNAGASLDGDQTVSCGNTSIMNVDLAQAYWNAKPSGSKLDSVSASEVSAGATASRTEFAYDSPFTTGNLIQQRQWDSAKAAYTASLTDANSIKSAYAYDAWGNLTSTTDPNSNVTSFTVNGCSGAAKSAYPTAITAGGLTLNQTWDCSSGLLKSATDPNMVLTRRAYDNLGRTTLIEDAVGLPRERQTVMEYVESSTGSQSQYPLIVTTRADLVTKLDKSLVSTQLFDQRGQVTTSLQPDQSVVRHLSSLVVSGDGATYEATSNPYFSGNETTAGWTVNKRDQLGRVISSTHLTGSALPYPWGANSTTSGQSTTVYNGYSTVARDEESRGRQMIVDAAGRLKTVNEDPTGLNYSTTYNYDGLDNLLGVNQGGLTRTFAYSSLKRLTSATNPESGTVNYGYDGNGNLLTRADARVSMAISGYDALNRPLVRSYTPTTTPTVIYRYDICANGKARLCGVESTATTMGYVYDELGRVTQATQTTGQAYVTNYSYNLAGGVTAVEYPGSTASSPRKVSYAYDPSGRVIAVYRGAIGSTDKYVQSVAYWPGGAEQTTTLGNGVVEETSLNGRLQMIGRTAKLGAATLWGVAYGFSATTNNGNPLSQTVTGPTPFTQNYWYDPLNRLQAVQDSLIGVPSPAPLVPVGVGPATQVFAYDRFGNRAVVNASYGSAGAPVAQVTGSPTVADLAAAAATNFTGNRTNGLAHDTSGNVLSLNGTATYDAENRLATATYIPDPAMQNAIWTLRHTYDGDGRRVKSERVKPDGSLDTATVYVYGAGGELVQEYGPLPATVGRTYLTSDQLGSTRLVTKSSGDATTIVASRNDYLPFGEEISRGAGFGGGPTQKFTGKERDAETGLDYFGARYMSAAQGRFISPDWSEIPQPIPYADLADPQTLNLYAYVRNNPVTRIDPDGHCCAEAASFGRQLTRAPHPLVRVGGYAVIGVAAAATALSNFTVREVASDFLSYAVENGGKSAAQLDRDAESGRDVEVETVRAGKREAMRGEGIPTSQQPDSQTSSEGGRQSVYTVPKAGGGSETKVVTVNHNDRSHPNQTHVEAGRAKPGGQTDTLGRLRVVNDKTKVNVKPKSEQEP